MSAALVAGAGVLGAAVGLTLEPVIECVPLRRPLRGWRRTELRPGRAIGVAVLTAGLYGGLTARYHDSAVLLAYLVLAAGLTALSAIDLAHLLLPNRLVYPLVVVTAGLLAGAAAGDGEWPSFGRALLAGAAAVLVFGLLHLASPASMGMGDVKLVAALGLALGWLGWGEVVLGAVLGFVSAAVVALALVLARRVDRRDHLPFGPFLAAGTLTTLLVA